MRFRIFLSAYSIIIWSFLFSQDSLPKNIFCPSLNTNIGYVIKAYPGVPQSNYALLTNLSFAWQTQGRDKWHQYYHFPRFGFDTYFNTFDNSKYLGNSCGIVPFLEVNSKHENRSWRFKFGMGIGYFTKTFDLISNPNNFYIGSKLCNMTTAMFFWKKPLSKNLSLLFGVSSIHFSNGHTALPNAGMNMLNVHLGISYQSRKAEQFVTQADTNRRFSYTVKLGVGFHEFGATTKAVGGPGYPSYHLSFWVSKPVKQIHLWQLGFTAAYYTSFYDYIVSEDIYQKDQNLKSCTGILFAGHEFVFGKISFSSQLGFYVYNPFFIKQKKLEGSWIKTGQKLEAFNTNRVGILYYPFKKRNTLNALNSQLFMGVFLKANLAQADLFEYSFGYTF